MRKLAAVEEARAVMTEGMEWSAWKWLLERSRVREIADRATEALNRSDRRVKTSWPEELKTAYAELAAGDKQPLKKNGTNHTSEAGSCNAKELRQIAKKIKEADDRAERCRLEAEEMFEVAEQRFSADMARQGARKALETYDLREAAIKKAEAAAEQN